MIVQLVGTVVEVTPFSLVLDVNGVGYELGISSSTAGTLPPAGTSGVRVLTRMNVREGSIDLYGFSTREERALFDRLVAVSGVGPSLALSVLSTYNPGQLAGIVAAGDVARMTAIPRVGKKLAGRLLLELQGVFEKDASLHGLMSQGQQSLSPEPSASSSVDDDVMATLMSMGFTQREAELSLQGREEASADTIEGALRYALRRLGRNG